MPMNDFKQIYALINEQNKNQCEENGGVIYCYKCQSKDAKRDSFTGHYEPITLKLNQQTYIKLPAKYYLDYDPENDRCLLLFKGVNGDLDHWVLGDSFLKILYLVFDADNFQVGVMTNSLTLGWDHEELVTIEIPKPFISNDTLIRSIAITIVTILIGIISFRCYVKRRRALALKKMRKRADEIYRNNQSSSPRLESSNKVENNSGTNKRRRSAELNISNIEMIQYSRAPEQVIVKIEPQQQNLSSGQTSEDLSQRSYASNFSYNSMVSQESYVSSNSNTNSYYSSSGTSSASLVGSSGGSSQEEKPLRRHHNNKSNQRKSNA